MEPTSTEAERLAHENDKHHGAASLSEVVLGGQDGLVNVLGLVLGLSMASGSSRLILAGGFSAALAESVSMAAVAYTSTLAKAAQYQAEREREHRHIRVAPTLERQEVRDLYAKKGFSGPLLDQVVDTITANPEVWVAVMMSEELGLAPVERRDGLRAAVVVGFSSLAGSLLPLLPFLFLGPLPASIVATVLGALLLFALGVYKAKVTVGAPLRSGLELAAIGVLSSAVGLGVGWLFRV